MTDCYCRGQAVCPSCEHHTCTDCYCDPDNVKDES